MARQRRGRSRGPELRGTLGTLLRTTLAQAGAVREVLERGAREGRARLDEVRSERRRDHALAELGELVIELIERGEVPELEDHPEIQAALQAVAELGPADDDRGAARERRPVAGRDFVTPSRRGSFDARRGDGGDGGGREARGARGARGRDGRDDDGGAVSSRAWRPPAPTAADGRVWRPPRDGAGGAEPGEPGARDPAAEPGARFRERGEPAAAGRPERAGRTEPAAPARPETRPRAPDRPAGRGGIAFDDDADLADYMNPDDVPGTDKK